MWNYYLGLGEFFLLVVVTLEGPVHLFEKRREYRRKRERERGMPTKFPTFSPLTASLNFCEKAFG